MSKQILQNLFQGHSYGNFKGAAGLKLQFYGNEKTMNLNPLILANIQNSPYFKVGKVYSLSKRGVTFYLFFLSDRAVWDADFSRGCGRDLLQGGPLGALGDGLPQDSRPQQHGHVWGGEGRVRWGGHLISILPPLQTLHTQTHQEAGESLVKFSVFVTHFIIDCLFPVPGAVSA